MTMTQNAQHYNGPLMLWANWTTVDTIHLKDNTFVIGVRIQATVDTKFKDSPAHIALTLTSMLSEESRNAPVVASG